MALLTLLCYQEYQCINGTYIYVYRDQPIYGFILTCYAAVLLNLTYYAQNYAHASYMSI